MVPSENAGARAPPPEPVTCLGWDPGIFALTGSPLRFFSLFRIPDTVSLSFLLLKLYILRTRMMKPHILITRRQPHPLLATFPPTIYSLTIPGHFCPIWVVTSPHRNLISFSVPCILYKLVIGSGGLLRIRTGYCCLCPDLV